MTNDTSNHRTRNRNILLAFLVVALLLAGGVSFYASSQPDGLNKVAADKGFDVNVRDHDLSGSPFAGYGTAGVDNPRLSKGLSGVIGVGITLLLGAGLFLVVRRRGSGGDGTAAGSADSRPGQATGT